MPEQLLVLKGKAKVWKEGEFIHAELITINIVTGDITLTSPKGTVNPKEQSSFHSQTNTVIQ